MNGPSGTDLLALRLQAAARGSSRVDTLSKALQHVVDSLYVELVDEHAWDATEALAVVMQELNRAQQRLAQLALPD